jgi:hypothetical protein
MAGGGVGGKELEVFSWLFVLGGIAVVGAGEHVPPANDSASSINFQTVNIAFN